MARAMRSIANSHSALLSQCLMSWAKLGQEEHGRDRRLRCMALAIVKFRERLLQLRVLGAWQQACCCEACMRIVAKGAEPASEPSPSEPSQQINATFHMYQGAWGPKYWPIGHVSSTTPVEMVPMALEFAPRSYGVTSPILALDEDKQRARSRAAERARTQHVQLTRTSAQIQDKQHLEHQESHQGRQRQGTQRPQSARTARPLMETDAVAPPPSRSAIRPASASSSNATTIRPASASSSNTGYREFLAKGRKENEAQLL